VSAQFGFNVHAFRGTPATQVTLEDTSRRMVCKSTHKLQICHFSRAHRDPRSEQVLRLRHTDTRHHFRYGKKEESPPKTMQPNVSLPTENWQAAPGVENPDRIKTTQNIAA